MHCLNYPPPPALRKLSFVSSGGVHRGLCRVFIYRVRGTGGTGGIDVVEEVWRGNWMGGHSRQETKFDTGG